MTDHSKRPPHAVNKIFDDPVRELPLDERDSVSPDDTAEHDQWLRDNVPPHHD